MINGVTHQPEDGADLELAEEMGAMGFDRPYAHSEFAGDLLGGLILRDQAQDL